MSIEFQLAHACPHLTLEEPVRLASDRRGLPIRQPIASSNSVRILANNEFFIPSSGLLSLAQLQGVVSGPFNISCHTQTLTVQSSTETATFQLPVGTRVPTDTIVQLIAKTMTSVEVENLNGYLSLTDISRLGQESRLFVSGSALPILGLDRQVGARGQVLYPAWRLSSREDTISNRYPQFVSPIKQTQTLFKVSYVAPAERCLRCRGTHIENDYLYNIQGDAFLIENENLLYQAALKILLTEKGSNPFHLAYGTQIKSRIGTKAIGAVATLLNEDVRKALQNLQVLQKEQARYQEVSPKERLYSVLSVDVLRHQQDQTVFLVDVVVSNASGEPINISIVFSVPGVIALVGTNNLSLGLETTGLTHAEATSIFKR